MLIHCTMEELIAIREGEGSIRAREHVDGCEGCRNELERLHQRVAALKALPAFTPPRDRWEVVARRVRLERRRRFLGRGVATLLAAAASLSLMIGGKALITAHARGPEQQQIEALVRTSDALEARLRSIEPKNRVMNLRVAGTLVQLEDRLHEVDQRLASLKRSKRDADVVAVELWRQRVGLMNALVQVRQVRAVEVGF